MKPYKFYNTSPFHRVINSSVVLALFAFFLFLQHQDAFAAFDPMTLCNLANLAEGNLGRGLATIAIIALGVGAMLGKVSWGMAALVGSGIAVIFNADEILALIATSC